MVRIVKAGKKWELTREDDNDNILTMEKEEKLIAPTSFGDESQFKKVFFPKTPAA